MFKRILVRELADLLLSLRFAMTAVLVVALMAAGAVLFVADYREAMADYRNQVNENLEGLRQQAGRRAALFRLLSFRDQRIYRTPNPMVFMAEGAEADLPNAFSVDAFVLHSPENLARTNPSLWSCRKLDWTFVVMLVLSFAGIVLTYDGISGERETQVLRLVMAHPVPRSTVILGKYAGATVCLMLLFLLGVLIHLAILSLSGLVSIDLELLTGVGVGLLFSGIYVSIFVMTGLFLSSLFRESATSLVVCLLMWALLVVAVPNLGGILAGGLVELPGPEDVRRDGARAWREARDAYDRSHSDPNAWIMSGNWSPGEPLARAIVTDEAKERVYLSYWTQMLAQARLGRMLTRLSPAAAYRYAMEGVAGSGLEHYARFMEQARRYREGLKLFLLSKYPTNPDHPYSDEIRRKALAVSVGFEEIPKFEEQLAKPSEALADALPDFLLLALWGVLAFAAAYVSFLRCDVR